MKPVQDRSYYSIWGELLQQLQSQLNSDVSIWLKPCSYSTEFFQTALFSGPFLAALLQLWSVDMDAIYYICSEEKKKKKNMIFMFSNHCDSLYFSVTGLPYLDSSK